MAMTMAQQNAVSEFQSLATDLVRIKYRMLALVQIYTNESIGSLTTEDLQAYGPFAHVTSAELQSAGGSLAAINTALGDFGTGTAVANFLKIVTGVPK